MTKKMSQRKRNTINHAYKRNDCPIFFVNYKMLSSFLCLFIFHIFHIFRIFAFRDVFYGVYCVLSVSTVLPGCVPRWDRQIDRETGEETARPRQNGKNPATNFSSFLSCLLFVTYKEAGTYVCNSICTYGYRQNKEG